jgi:hypothetical protein
VKPLQFFVLSLAALGTIQCHGSSASPTPTPTTTALVAPASVTIARNDSATVTAKLQKSDGTTTDVTATAYWTTSDSSIVTVQAGVLKAVGVGTATIRVSESGLAATIAVTAIRNTLITGVVTVAETSGRRSIHAVGVFIDSNEMFGRWYSSAISEVSVGIGNTNVAPGNVALLLRVTPDPTLHWEENFATGTGSYVNVIDKDTGELVERLSLNVVTGYKAAENFDPIDFTWTLTIGTYH